MNFCFLAFPSILVDFMY